MPLGDGAMHGDDYLERSLEEYYSTEHIGIPAGTSVSDILRSLPRSMAVQLGKQYLAAAIGDQPALEADIKLIATEYHYPMFAATVH
jgi:hypothetical protein